VLTHIALHRYSGLGSYSLAASLASAPPEFSSLSNFSFGWSGLYSASLANPLDAAQVQLQLTVADREGFGNQVITAAAFPQCCSLSTVASQSCVARAWISDMLLLEGRKSFSGPVSITGDPTRVIWHQHIAQRSCRHDG
jgi:hypothetical protein